jgi:hypothetical protein
MKIIKERFENYIYYFNELLKNKSLIQSNELVMKVGKTSMHVNRDSITALIDFHNKYSEEDPIKYS